MKAQRKLRKKNRSLWKKRKADQNDDELYGEGEEEEDEPEPLESLDETEE